MSWTQHARRWLQMRHTAQRLALAYAAYRLGRPRTAFVYLQLTDRCNLRCRHCVKRGIPASQELSTEQLLRLIRALDRGGVAFLGVTGGEPLVRRDFATVAAAIGRSRLYSVINTNGTLIDDGSAVTLGSAFDMVRVSLDGLQPAHDAIRGAGSFARALHGLRLLHAVPRRRARVGVSITVGPQNVDQVDQLIEQIRPLCDTFSMMPVTDQQEAPIAGAAGSDDAPRRSVFGTAAYDDLVARRRSDRRLEVFWNEGSQVSVTQGQRLCDAGTLYHFVVADGRVVPCPGNEHLLGHLCRQPWRSIAHRPPSPELTTATARCPGCFMKCTTEPSMLFRTPPHRLLGLGLRLARTYV